MAPRIQPPGQNPTHLAGDPAFSGTYVPLVPFKSGYHYAPPCTVTAGIRGEGNLEVTAFDIGQAVTIDRLFAEVTVVGTVGAVLRLGLYASTAEGLPGALVVDGGTINGTSATVQSVTVSEALTPGRYWIGAAVQGGAGTRPTTRLNSGPGQLLVGAPASSTPGQFPSIGFTLSGVTGALPDPYGVPTLGAATAHRVFVRVA